MRSPWYLVVSVIMMLMAGYFVLPLFAPLLGIIQSLSNSSGTQTGSMHHIPNWLIPSAVTGLIFSLALISFGIYNLMHKVKPLWQSILGLVFISLGAATWIFFDYDCS